MAVMREPSVVYLNWRRPGKPPISVFNPFLGRHEFGRPQHLNTSPAMTEETTDGGTQYIRWSPPVNEAPAAQNKFPWLLLVVGLFYVLK